MAWDLSLTNLRNVLTQLFPTVQDARRIVDAAGLSSSHIAFDNAAITNWHNILVEAMKRQQVPDLVDAALEEYPENQELILAAAGQLVPIPGPRVGPRVPWRGPDDRSQLEKILGAQSSLVPISFLEVGLIRSRSVARIITGDGIGSGFLAKDNLLITNNHVLDTPDKARRATIQFNYQQTVDGLEAPYDEFHCRPEAGFSTSSEDDWTAVRLDSDPNKKWGWLPIAPANPMVGNRVNIIQHPGGGPKQLAFFHNIIAFINSTRVQYLTDTLPGSSGSPVFNKDWQVVALHHAGGFIPEPGTEHKYYRNEGVHINVVLAGLRNEGLLPGDDAP